jgi:hypothetical protein
MVFDYDKRRSRDVSVVCATENSRNFESFKRTRQPATSIIGQYQWLVPWVADTQQFCYAIEQVFVR